MNSHLGNLWQLYHLITLCSTILTDHIWPLNKKCSNCHCGTGYWILLWEHDKYAWYHFLNCIFYRSKQDKLFLKKNVVIGLRFTLHVKYIIYFQLLAVLNKRKWVKLYCFSCCLRVCTTQNKCFSLPVRTFQLSVVFRIHRYFFS